MNYDIRYFNGNFHDFFVQMDRVGTILGAFTTCKETPVQMKPTVKSLVCCEFKQQFIFISKKRN